MPQTVVMPTWLRSHRRKLALWGLSLFCVLPLVLVVLGRFVAPPITPLMLMRMTEGEGWEQRWVPIEAISPELRRAVMTSEDQRFCSHHGFDWIEIDEAAESYRDDGRVRGASTISMQTAKNVFLWPGRNILRKGLEAGFTVLIEALWGKRRILEVYLNVIEWGHGLYGAEAAAQHYFHRPAGALTRHQAAALAAILPNPRRFSPTSPSLFIANRIRIIESRMGQTAMSPCLGAP
ncbi:monofunctional biosynthetic peptidoglycan transglycosylase [Telmatospirillum sp.]|uniref:monofunctional biosynthetic peptidoglycan transglycosylase n=1 Tax=Telmatospirillum sp. TaxID=2079197 RepID=UPI0028405D6D|nr:monofunctional biosynthetic peptidoglycan transglycosylase [Telmatospirillum sp.]MDR3441107.1 monofunctional biosynthetic peptidoglycan transglycosylase [Telmatospirillum sp.]